MRRAGQVAGQVEHACKRAFATTRSALSEKRTHFFVKTRDGKVRLSNEKTASKAIETAEHEEFATSRPTPKGMFDPASKQFKPASTPAPAPPPVAPSSTAATTATAAATPAAEEGVVAVVKNESAKKVADTAPSVPLKAAPASAPTSTSTSSVSTSAAKGGKAARPSFGTTSKVETSPVSKPAKPEVSMNSFFAGVVVSIGGMVYMQRDVWDAARHLAEPLIDLDHSLRGLPTMAEMHEQAHAERAAEQVEAQKVREKMWEEAVHNSASYFNSTRRSFIDAVRKWASMSPIQQLEAVEEKLGFGGKSE